MQRIVCILIHLDGFDFGGRFKLSHLDQDVRNELQFAHGFPQLQCCRRLAKGTVLPCFADLPSSNEHSVRTVPELVLTCALQLSSVALPPSWAIFVPLQKSLFLLINEFWCQERHQNDILRRSFMTFR